MKMEELLRLLGDVQRCRLSGPAAAACHRLRAAIVASAPGTPPPTELQSAPPPKRSRRLRASDDQPCSPMLPPTQAKRKRPVKQDAKPQHKAAAQTDDEVSDDAKVTLRSEKKSITSEVEKTLKPVKQIDEKVNSAKIIPQPKKKQTSVKADKLKNTTIPIDETNDAKILPRSQRKSVSVNTEKKQMSSKSVEKNCQVVLDKTPITIDPETETLDTSTMFTKAGKSNAPRRNRKGETPLHSACVASKLDKVRLLLKEDADPNTKDNAGWTPMHEVVSNGSIEIIKLLLENGTLPFVPGPMNETPLHEAVKSKSIEAIRLLIQYGADINVRNSKGLTAYDMADDKIKPILSTYRNYEIETKFPSFLDLFNTELSTAKIYASSLSAARMKSLTKLTNQHKNITIEKNLHKDVTFVLLESEEDKTCRMTLDTLSAVLMGIPIINANWLDKCTSDSLVLLKDFQISNLGGYRDCVTLSYMNRLKQYPSLFNGCHVSFRHFKRKYEISSSLTVNREILAKFVTDGGGVVLKREPDPESIPAGEQLIPFHASIGGELKNCTHYIVYGDRPELAYNMKHIKSVPIAWLIESIQNFDLVDP